MPAEPIILSGARVSADISDIWTAAEWTQTIDGAPTLRLDVATSNHAKIHRVTRALSAVVRRELYTLVRVARTGQHRYQLELESAASVELKARGKGLEAGQRSVEAGTQSRRGFIRTLTKTVPELKLRGEPYTVKSKVELSTEDDDYWTAAQRVAGDIGRRVFVRRNALWFASDKWLLRRDPFATVTEGRGGVDLILWDVDTGREAATLDIVARTTELYAGDTVRVAGQGPADGVWIVEEVRGSQVRTSDNPRVDVRCVKPEPTLPEPEAAETDRGGVGDDGLSLVFGGLDFGAASGRVPAFLRALFKAEGKPYVWGGVSLSSGADCSGLMVAALRDIGVAAPRFTSHTVHQYGRRISVAQGIRTVGAVLWKSGHIAVSLGNGRTFEASSRARPIGSLNANGRGWQSAYILKWLT